MIRPNADEWNWDRVHPTQRVNPAETMHDAAVSSYMWLVGEWVKHKAGDWPVMTAQTTGAIRDFRRVAAWLPKLATPNLNKQRIDAKDVVRDQKFIYLAGGSDLTKRERLVVQRFFEKFHCFELKKCHAGSGTDDYHYFSWSVPQHGLELYCPFAYEGTVVLFDYFNKHATYQYLFVEHERDADTFMRVIHDYAKLARELHSAEAR
jgi:hypothetical protein